MFEELERPNPCFWAKATSGFLGNSALPVSKSMAGYKGLRRNLGGPGEVGMEVETRQQELKSQAKRCASPGSQIS